MKNNLRSLLLLSAFAATLPAWAGSMEKDMQKQMDDPESSALQKVSPWSIGVMGGGTLAETGSISENRSGFDNTFTGAGGLTGGSTSYSGLTSRSGFIVGGDVGYSLPLTDKWAITPGVEYLYQDSEANFNNTGTGLAGATPIVVSQELRIRDTHYFMPKATISYTFDRFTPYVGLGAGGALVDYRLTTSYTDVIGFTGLPAGAGVTSTQTKQTFEFATQFFLGTEWSMDEHWGFFGEYKLTYIPSISLNDSGLTDLPGTGLSRKLDDYITHNLALGLRYHF